MQALSDGTIFVFYLSLGLNVGMALFIAAGYTDKKGAE